MIFAIKDAHMSLMSMQKRRYARREMISVAALLRLPDCTFLYEGDAIERHLPKRKANDDDIHLKHRQPQF